jgi:hypothetical protein
MASARAEGGPWDSRRSQQSLPPCRRATENTTRTAKGSWKASLPEPDPARKDDA